uniref:Putative ovule protein n=1 Tax=Solanum chacoense TaxID=4108 RepID=A0A0V0HGZ7_SOLCH
MILGGDWMRNHNPVLLDFVAYEAQVSHLGRRVTLRGICNEGELQKMSSSSLIQFFKKGKGMWAHLFTITATTVESTELLPPAITSNNNNNIPSESH